MRLHESSEKGLAAKAEASGIPLSILRQVFNRGMAAWKTGHRPGVAQQQWAYGRVNSFITGSGGARKADADLWARAKQAKAESVDRHSGHVQMEMFGFLGRLRRTKEQKPPTVPVIDRVKRIVDARERLRELEAERKSIAARRAENKARGERIRRIVSGGRSGPAPAQGEVLTMATLRRTPLLIEGRRERREQTQAQRYRVLYHVAKQPAQPRPAHSQSARITGLPGAPPETWSRRGRQPVASGVFLTPDPIRVVSQHGVHGHVYAYRVPEHVIKQSGGIRTFDRATELLIPQEHWHKVEFLGKSMDAKQLFRQLQQRDQIGVMPYGDPFRSLAAPSGKQQKRNRKAADILRRAAGRRGSED